MKEQWRQVSFMVIELASQPSQRMGRNRNVRGTSMLELPAMLSLVLIMMLMPLLTLATMTLKSSLMFSVVQDGANEACKARTFENGTTDKPSAKTVADQVIRESASKWAGLTVSDVTTRIIIVPRPTGPATTQTVKLAAPADTSKFTYEIETIAQAKMEPLFKLSPKLFGSVPGLTTALGVTYAARRLAENPQGLNK